MVRKEGTPITGRVINHNHIENKMRQRQSWTTGQNESGLVSVRRVDVLLNRMLKPKGEHEAARRLNATM